MQFDDRLATVLRMRADGERAASTQYRQLLDLLGTSPGGADGGLLQRAFGRLEALAAALPAQDRAALIRDPGTRLRNPELVSFLAAQEPPIAAAAMSAARLSALQWEDLIRTLPAPARALLRGRRDLPEETRELLARIGIRGLGLPEPEAGREDGDVLELEPALEIGADDDAAGIGALVRRIEAFQRVRASAAANGEAPLLPLEEAREEPRRRIAAFDFASDAEGRITWAEPPLAPLTRGILLTASHADSLARAEPEVVDAIRRHQPVRGGRVEFDGAPAIAGEWRVDALPHFIQPGGGFAGYRGRMRRPAAPVTPASAPARDDAGERMRQVLHELRTPVNAIQGYAEAIHQQLFGYAPHEYRALAAAVAGDAARILAGFEELERLARLESGALAIGPGVADLAAIVGATVSQLDAVLRPRSAGLELAAPGGVCLVALPGDDAELLAWRLLATLAGAAGPGEALQVRLSLEDGSAVLAAELPASLAGRADLFDGTAPAQPQTVSSGMFGAGFALRLARAEARAAGGDLVREDDVVRLTLPLAANNPAENGLNRVDYGGDFAETG